MSQHHRNKTQYLIMSEIVRLHELVFFYHQQRFRFDYLRLKKYLYTKYAISGT
jgi:hypothetical protein